MSKIKERKALVSSIEKFTDSMLTHLAYAIERNPAGEGSRSFHVATIIEYAKEVLKAAEALR